MHLSRCATSQPCLCAVGYRRFSQRPAAPRSAHLQRRIDVPSDAVRCEEWLRDHAGPGCAKSGNRDARGASRRAGQGASGRCLVQTKRAGLPWYPGKSDPCRTSANRCERSDGGGGRNRTAVRRHSIPGTTCLAHRWISSRNSTMCEAHPGTSLLDLANG